MQTIKFGEHLIFDGYDCEFEKLTNMELCVDTLNNLAEIAGMKKLGEPTVYKAEGNDTLGGKDPGGFSGFLIVYESHISIHTFAKRGFVTIDLYSCKEFNREGIVELLVKTFKPKNYDLLKMDRGLKYPSDNIY